MHSFFLKKSAVIRQIFGLIEKYKNVKRKKCDDIFSRFEIQRHMNGRAWTDIMAIAYIALANTICRAVYTKLYRSTGWGIKKQPPKKN